MLDQNPDDPSANAGEPPASDGAPPDTSAGAAPAVDTPPQESETPAGDAGGSLGRFRAGMRGGKPTPPGAPSIPLWRRILVFLLKWGAIVTVAFLVISTILAFIIGFTGPPPTFTMASRAMSGIETRQDWTPLKRISPHLVRAVIAAEDTRFCSHGGFDMEEIRKAMAESEAGGRTRGASTISQQTAKNVFLFNGGGYPRKAVEAWFTVLIEQFWSKPRIMEIYLNVAEWGDGNFGAEAAAQARFGVHAKDLTPRQAALLAAVLPSPNRWKITGAYASRRASQIEVVMRIVRRDQLDSCVIAR